MKKIISVLLLVAYLLSFSALVASAEEIDDEEIIRQKIDACLDEYLEDLRDDNSEFFYKLRGKANEYVIFFGAFEKATSMIPYSQVIDGYLITVSGEADPYDLGWYAFDGKSIYTLKEAIDKELFKMSDVADLIFARLLGDATLDKKVDMTDVTELQKYIAGLTKLKDMEYLIRASDVDQNNQINMYGVVLIQRMIAKL